MALLSVLGLVFCCSLMLCHARAAAGQSISSKILSAAHLQPQAVFSLAQTFPSLTLSTCCGLPPAGIG